MQLQNVVRLNSNSVFLSIKEFLRNKGIRSKNTESAYENDIRQFFRYIAGKELEELTDQDLKIKHSDMLGYQNYLYKEYVQPNSKRYSNITINRKCNAVLSLYRHLKRDGYDVDPDVIKVDELPDDTKQIGFLTVDEIDSMLLINNNMELKAFILIALHTSMRKNAILALEWNQISQSYEDPDFYIIRIMDKNKQDFKEIHKSIYELLLSIKKDEKYVFTIPRSTLDYQFKALCKKAGIDYEKRKISIHSLRKAGVDFVKQYTNDIQAAQAQATHSSPTITAAIYTQKPKNLAARLLIEQVDNNIFDELTHEELLELIKSQTNGLLFKFKMDAKKIVDKRKK